MTTLGIVLIVLGCLLLYARSIHQKTPAQRRKQIFWTPTAVFGFLATLIFISPTPDGGMAVLTYDGFRLFVLFAVLAAGFGWLAHRYAVRRQNMVYQPDPNTPMDVPWEEGPRAA